MTDDLTTKISKYKEGFDIYNIMEKAYSIFEDKYKEYGNTFLLMSQLSLNDQIISKLLRLKNVESGNAMLVSESIEDTTNAIINYLSVEYAMFNVPEQDGHIGDIPTFSIGGSLDYFFDSDDIFELHSKKTKDYGDAMFGYEPTTIVDIVVSKLLRIKNKTLTNKEKIKSDLMDCVVYMCTYMHLKTNKQINK